MAVPKKCEGEPANLIRTALELGAGDACVVDTSVIIVDEKLAGYCREPRCPNYGKSINCPPLGMGPRQFGALLESYKKALVFKINVPTEKLLSEERFVFFKKLQIVTSSVEKEAKKRGFNRARGFAGGSCKEIFCKDQSCLPLEQAKPCRYPDVARPSMSGLGVNVFELMAAIGWEIQKIDKNTDPEKVASGTLVGMVLL